MPDPSDPLARKAAEYYCDGCAEDRGWAKTSPKLFASCQVCQLLSWCNRRDDPLSLARDAVAMDEAGGRLSWLACLIADYVTRWEALEDYHQKAHGECWDKDGDATCEMLQECRALLAGLQRAFPCPEPEPAPPAVDDSNIPF